MRDAFQRADLAATLPHPQTNMSAMTMSAALVAGKVSVTSKCVRETWRVAKARAGVDPAPGWLRVLHHHR